jgi:hypothetical protein
LKEEARQIALHREHGIALCNERVNWVDSVFVFVFIDKVEGMLGIL